MKIIWSKQFVFVFFLTKHRGSLAREIILIIKVIFTFFFKGKDMSSFILTKTMYFKQISCGDKDLFKQK